MPLSYFISSLSTFPTGFTWYLPNKQRKAYYLGFFLLFKQNLLCVTDKQCVFIKASGDSRTDRLTLLLRQLFLFHLKNTIINITIGCVISCRQTFFIAISRLANLCEEWCVCVPAAIRWTQPPLTSCFHSISIMPRQPQSAALLLLGTVYGTYAHNICRYSPK